MTSNDFASLGLAEPILRALAARDYHTPTPIQARAIPPLLQGRDLLGIAQTGTGKTAAFALPMLQLLTAANRPRQPRMPRALVLAPTRELATQIADSAEAYGRFLALKVAIVFGGVGQTPQVQTLQRGVDILVATPGRLLDLIQQRHISLGAVEILVLDEADRMLDMGFLPDVKRILATLPKDRQSLLFSATMPQDITALANSLLRNPQRVEVTPPAKTADRIAQSVYFVTKAGKRDLLVDLLADPQFERTLVFTRTKHGANRVAQHLVKARITAYAIHGNKSQSARERALDEFRSGKAPVLVATDIAARGIDVPEITHVINFDLPNIPESYVHRIGRTARAGRDGIAISFCDHEEREFLRDIEKLIQQRIPVQTAAGSAAARPAAAGAPAGTAAPARPAPAPQPHRQAQPARQQPARPQPAPQKVHGDPWAAAIDFDDEPTPRWQGNPAPSRPHGDPRPMPQPARRPAPHGHGQPRPPQRPAPAPGGQPQRHGQGQPQRQGQPHGHRSGGGSAPQRQHGPQRSGGGHSGGGGGGGGRGHRGPRPAHRP